MSYIIKADPSHLFWLRLLWEMLQKEKSNKYPDVREAADDFTRAVANSMQNPQSLLAAFLAIKGHRAIGFILGEIRYRPIGLPHWYGYIDFIYVRPEHRDKEVAASLATAWVEWLMEQRIQSQMNGGAPFQVDTVEGAAYHGDDYWKEHGFEPYLVTYMAKVPNALNKQVVPARKEKSSHGSRRI